MGQTSRAQRWLWPRGSFDHTPGTHKMLPTFRASGSTDSERLANFLLPSPPSCWKRAGKSPKGKQGVVILGEVASAKEHGTLESGGTTDEQRLVRRKGVVKGKERWCFHSAHAHIQAIAMMRPIWGHKLTPQNDGPKTTYDQMTIRKWSKDPLDPENEKTAEYQLIWDHWSVNLVGLTNNCHFWHLPGYSLGTRISLGTAVEKHSVKKLFSGWHHFKTMFEGFYFVKILLTVSFASTAREGHSKRLALQRDSHCSCNCFGHFSKGFHLDI